MNFVRVATQTSYSESDKIGMHSCAGEIGSWICGCAFGSGNASIVALRFRLGHFSCGGRASGSGIKLFGCGVYAFGSDKSGVGPASAEDITSFGCGPASAEDITSFGCGSGITSVGSGNTFVGSGNASESSTAGGDT